MHRYRKKLLIAMQRYSMILLLGLGMASAKVSAEAPARIDDCRNPKSAVTTFNSALETSGLPSLPIYEICTTVDQRVTKEFDKAWRLAYDGLGYQEAVVLIFRTECGSYTGESPGFSNGYKKATFQWNPAALAIIHTHPNRCDPRPSEQDRRVADKYAVPIFTLTSSGMYMYDPAMKTTSKVLNGLAWLDPINQSHWAREMVQSLNNIASTAS